MSVDLSRHSALRLLRAFCRPDLVEDIEGDLLELYEKRIRSGRPRTAALLIWYDVLRFFRPYALRHRSADSSRSLHPIMLKNYISVSLRHLRRHAGFSAINIAGLAVGIAVALLTLLYVTHERSFDRFHAKADRIARIHMTWNFGETSFEVALSTTAPGPVSAERISGVEKYVRFRRLGETYLRADDKGFMQTGIVYADSTIFDVFTFPLLAGNPDEALAGPGRIVLTESAAETLFGTTDVVGETLLLDGEDVFEITGVMEDVPENSHIRFSMAASFASLPQAGKQAFDSSMYHTYVLLSPGMNITDLQAGLDEWMAERFGPDFSSRPKLHAMPFSDIYLHSDVQAEWTPEGDIRYIRMFGIIAALILMIACINYMNLATSRSVHRAAEVGMRKVLGAKRRQVFWQFLGEALLMTLLALIFAVVIVRIALPFYNAFTGQSQTFVDVLRPGAMFAAWLSISVIAGSYPAFVLSNLLPLRILKGAYRTSGGGRLLRKSLVVVQFMVTFILIAGTLTINRQLDYIRAKDLGYDSERMLVVSADGPARDLIPALMDEWSSVSSVVDLSAVSHPPSGGAGARTYNPGTTEETRQLVSTMQIDENFVRMMGMDLIAGRAPTDDEAKVEDENVTKRALLNKKAAELFGWTPEEAVGKVVWSAGTGSDVEFVGVTEDFHFSPLYQQVEPLVMMASPYAYHVLVRTAAGDVEKALAEVRAVWERVVPDRPFDYVFQDARFEAHYRTESRIARLFTVFSGLAVLIACLGLLGLAAFTVVQRTKEIGIRKVLGATPFGLSVLVLRDFVILVGLAMIVAAPVAFYLSQRWLERFAFHVDPSLVTFLIAGTLSIGIAVLTVLWQSLKAAATDPVISIRSEL